MTDREKLIELAELAGVNARADLTCYFFDFEATGVPEVDLILAAVCWAGKQYHHTAAWSDDGWNGEPSEVTNIQKAANFAANSIRPRTYFKGNQ